MEGKGLKEEEDQNALQVLEEFMMAKEIKQESSEEQESYYEQSHE